MAESKLWRRHLPASKKSVWRWRISWKWWWNEDCWCTVILWTGSWSHDNCESFCAKRWKLIQFKGWIGLSVTSSYVTVFCWIYYSQSVVFWRHMWVEGFFNCRLRNRAHSLHILIPLDITVLSCKHTLSIWQCILFSQMRLSLWKNCWLFAERS